MKRNVLLFSTLLPVLFAISCNKENVEEEDAEPSYLGIEIKDAKGIYEVLRNESATLNLAVVADPSSAGTYTIAIGVNPGLVRYYNTTHKTAYELLPSSAYSFAGTSVKLPRKSAASSSIELKLNGEGCEIDKVYLLPVAIDDVKGGKNFYAYDENAAFILFKMVPPPPEGSGTASDPYLIQNIENFMHINDLLKNDETVYFKLTSDLDFSPYTFNNEKDADGNYTGKPWIPINNAEGADAEAIAATRGIVFDGDGHTISNFKAPRALIFKLMGSVQNLTIDGAEIESEGGSSGIIAEVAGSIEKADEILVKNVTVKNSKISTPLNKKRTAAVIGYAVGGVFENVKVEACKVSGEDQQVAGLVARLEKGSIIDCSVSAELESGKYYVGGIVGWLGEATIRNCTTNVKIVNYYTTYARTGGLVGHWNGGGTIEHCATSGSIEAYGHYIGGVVAVISSPQVDNDYVEATANDKACSSTMDLTLPTTASARKSGEGGVVGCIESTTVIANVSDCYATGTLIGYRWSSGFVGYNNGTLHMNNGYTACDISGIALADASGVVLGNNKAGAEVKCSGVVGWNVSGRAICFPAGIVSSETNYCGTEGTVSSHAKTFNWDSSIWDLSKDFPTLK